MTGLEGLALETGLHAPHPLAHAPQVNPITSRAAFEAARAAVAADPGGYHGAIAARNCHWFVADAGLQGAWLSNADGVWEGWDAHTAEPLRIERPDGWAPWRQAFDASDPPFFRWFVGGRTNAAFNEVDRWVLAGHGADTALIFEGDRFDLAADGGRGAPVDERRVSRRVLLAESVCAAVALRRLGLQAGDRIAFNMPSIPEQIVWTEGAKRAGILYTAVFGGFSDKTLSDRIADCGARVVLTADGSYRNAQVAPFKAAYTDPALDNFVSVAVALSCVAAADSGLGEDGRAVVLDAVREALAGELTVERSEVMRGVGRGLAALTKDGRIEPGEAARARVSIAEALVSAPPRVETVIVVRHAGVHDLVWRPERDRWAHELLAAARAEVLAAAQAAGADVADWTALMGLPDRELVRALWAACPPLPVEANTPLFMIYTSGSTGKPKGIVHAHGYLPGIIETMRVAFDARPGDVMYTVADPGWITGQSYLIAGALSSGVTTLVTEGSPVYPHAGRFAAQIERHGVTIFKAGVTFLKSVMSDPASLREVKRYDMGGLRVATFCAEPCSPSVQAFGMEHVTRQYINSYWATEHGGIAWTHPFGNSDLVLKPDTHAWPLPWIAGDVWVEDGAELPSPAFANARAPSPASGTDAKGQQAGSAWRRAADGEKGEVVITQPYPYLARTVWGDADNYRVIDGVVDAAWRGDAGRWAEGYWGKWQGTYAYTQGDFAIRHEDGSFSFHGRSDDVINVSGHRMGTEEIEGAILKDKLLDPDSPVGNVIVVGAPHREKGLTPLAFVQPVAGRRLSPDDRRRLADLVRSEKGAVAVPQDFLEVSAFPETRSGKYMRRMVRALAEGGDVGDRTTLKNPAALDEIASALDGWRRRQTIADEQTTFERYRYWTIQYNDAAPGRRVATVTIDNPPVNALNERALDELVVVGDRLAAQDNVVAVIFTGAGTTFVAGADIRQLLEEVHTIEDARVLPATATMAFGKLSRGMNKPVIAAINGPALGGGFEFALACHYRIAEPDVPLGLPEIRLNLLPGYGGTQRLPRLMWGAGREDGVRWALELILSGRSITGHAAWRAGIVDDCIGMDSSGHSDVLSHAHHVVRRWLRDGPNSRLGKALAAREEVISRVMQPVPVSWERLVADPYITLVREQAERAGRGPALARALDAVRTGLEQSIMAGMTREAELFTQAVIDPAGGKAGIRAFLDKVAAPLPVRRDGVFDYGAVAGEGAAAEAAGELLPRRSAFHPGVTPVPPKQYAFGVARDPATGAPRHGPPGAHERELIVPVDEPGPNDALVYMLTSEVNFNDIWAITGIPVSPFDNHENDYQTTGSGGVGLVAALGQEARREGRLKVGDLVAVYSGTSDLLSPAMGLDPMFADFAIQGYETETGSHAQFLVCQAPQLHKPPPGLTLEQAGSYILNLGTVYRCLFTTLKIDPGARIFVEGSATGTGLDALRSAVRTGLNVTGLVSSAGRAEFVRGQGAVGAIDRKDPRWAAAFTPVPEDPAEWAAWEAAGEPIAEEYRRLNGGALADFAVSHAGEQAFPRTFQLLAEGGRLAFYGASSGYHFSFMGHAGSADPPAMLRQAALQGGESVLVYYGPGSRDLLDETGLAIIEAARAFRAKTVVVTTTDGQRAFLSSLGLDDAIEGIVSLETLKRREGERFDWPATMPRLADAKTDIVAFKAGVRDYQERTLKPFGSAVGKLLRSAANPRGAPDLIFERAAQDTLGVSTSLVKPFTGRVVFSEDLKGRRFTFYAPQVWTRQRRILMPTASILGTHLCNAHEVTRMNEMIAAGLLEVTPPTVVDWHDLPRAHQSMWDNTHQGATMVVNHALPAMGITSRDELFELWAAGA